MKKSLLALAVMAAAGAANAQSSVTLFGIVDASLTWGRGSIADRFQVTDSGYNSSRLGFRGTEDLGGGMSASFWLEAGLNNDNGTGDATSTNNQASGAGTATTGTQGLTFNRRSTVSLGGNWGEVRIGRDYTPHFWNLTVFDPFGTNGVGTNQMLNGVGLPFNPFTGTAAASANPGGFYSTQVRASNSIGYFFPRNLGGFYGQVQAYWGENLEDTVNEDAGSGYSIRVGFASGPFNIAAAYGKTDFEIGVGAPAVNFNGDIKTFNIGGQWDFGMAKLMGQWSRDEANIGGLDLEGTGWLIGGLIPVGAGEIRIAYSQYEVETNAGLGEPRTRKIAVGYVHNLSKRTALYTTYAYLRNNNGASSSLGGASTAANNNSQGLDIGIRHSF